LAKVARIKDAGNAKRAATQTGNDNAAKNNSPTDCGTVVSKPRKKPTRSSDAKATASGTNRGSVERMDKLAKD
jgi:hypothetical protein